MVSVLVFLLTTQVRDTLQCQKSLVCSKSTRYCYAKKKNEKEIHVGRVAGPFEELPIKSLRISPLGLYWGS